jgi:hypothetical protein
LAGNSAAGYSHRGYLADLTEITRIMGEGVQRTLIAQNYYVSAGGMGYEKPAAFGTNCEGKCKP